MFVLRGMPGQHINNFAAELAREAAKHGAATGKFNDIELVANATSTADDLIAQWDQKMQDARIAYQNSPEGKANAAAREARINAAQETHDRLIRDLATLDFTNDVAVLDWICAIQDSTDHVSVAVNKAAILSAFEAAGFVPGANVGDAFKPDDRENVFRYIVGQALDCLKSVAIHGVVHKFVDDWKSKFLKQPT